MTLTTSQARIQRRWYDDLPDRNGHVFPEGEFIDSGIVTSPRGAHALSDDMIRRGLATRRGFDKGVLLALTDEGIALLRGATHPTG